jgi:hypothetical protein
MYRLIYDVRKEFPYLKCPVWRKVQPIGEAFLTVKQSYIDVRDTQKEGLHQPQSCA